jgi:transmembrane sensor
MNRRTVDEKTREEASVWLARLDRGLREHEGASLQQWLESPSHRHVILELARMWHGPDTVAVLSALFPKSTELEKPQRSRRGLLIVSLTAVVAISIVGTWAFTLDGHLPSYYLQDPHYAQDGFTRGIYVTAIGEQRELNLPDKSSIMMNTGTRMGIDFSLRSRDVSIQYGEASFHVAYEPDRPFTVRAGKRAFQAVGTHFNVRVLTPDNVEVTVTEGMVKVLWAPPVVPETPELRRMPLTFGEETVGALETALVEPGYQSIRKVGAAELEALVAWQRGMLIFEREPLESVLAEVDRYTTTKFVLADEKLRLVRFSGYFRIGDMDGLLVALRKDFDIDSRRDGQGRVVLTASTAL